MSEAPLVSICIPTYNNTRFLRECLDSINSQTYRNIEVLVGDDGSTDDTVRIINEYVEKYSFKLHRNESNLGAAATSSALVSRSSGEYVAVFHSDDVYHETIVEEAVAVLDRDRSIGIVGSLGNVINSAGEITGEFRLHPEIKKLKKESYTFDDMMLGTLLNKANDIFIVTPSVVARRSAYQDVGLYAEKYKDIYDYEMWLRIALAGYLFGCVQASLGCYRILPDSAMADVVRTEQGDISVMDRVFADPRLPAEAHRVKDQAYFNERSFLARSRRRAPRSTRSRPSAQCRRCSRRGSPSRPRSRWCWCAAPTARSRSTRRSRISTATACCCARSPRRASPAGVARRATEIAQHLARRLNYLGVLTIEFFVQRNGGLLVNRLAPRPHTSGHFTLDACATGQFEQQVRALCGMPLGSTELLQPAVTVNLLGEHWQRGTPDWPGLLRVAGAQLHLYDKRPTRAQRKMGHVTCVAPTLDQAFRNARTVEGLLAPAGGVPAAAGVA